ncbi:hypothetical protein ACFV27_15595 [Streptomyces antimycoticus]|uniref:hypothetical protein n=1 Tax=Streptomyces antimycoticus TaxID=68175 RepID=UPI0025702549|nr:hypothetical protein [Streptomyces antimycoticus]WJE01633.1 hypothetical protein QR300_40045 [Streptomyces antimycoticus]
MTGKLRRLSLAAAGGMLSLGAVLTTAGHVNAAPTATYYGTYEHRDGCVYLVTSSGTPYYLPVYTMGGNGGLYKQGGGFIAYPGWNIKANGTAYTSSGGTTLCTTWGTDHRIKATSIYSY